MSPHESRADSFVDAPLVHAVSSPSLLGESPFWHPHEQCLYWCDIPGKRLNRLVPSTGESRHWDFDSEPASCAPMLDGMLLLAMRDGLWRFDPERGERQRLVAPPYDPSKERFNDGKCDPLGRFWVGTIYEPRDAPAAALYCFEHGELTRMADGVTVANGLAWSPDGRIQYWTDTTSHTVFRFDAAGSGEALSRRQVFASFPRKVAGQDLSTYGGRPDGAAVDVEGCYWVALFEGRRIVRLDPEGQLLSSIELPVRCPTMPCFGDDDLRTLYVTTARENRPSDELALEPLAGCVLALRVAVSGLPVNFVSP